MIDLRERLRKLETDAAKAAGLAEAATQQIVALDAEIEKLGFDPMGDVAEQIAGLQEQLAREVEAIEKEAEALAAGAAPDG